MSVDPNEERTTESSVQMTSQPCDDHASDAGAEEVRPPGFGLRRATCWFTAFWFVILVAVFNVYYDLIHGHTTADIRLAMPWLQLLFAACAVRFYGWPRKRSEWVTTTGLHLFLVWNYWLIDNNLHSLALTYLTEFLFRLAIMGGWGLVFVGVATFGHVVAMRHRRHRHAGRVLKASFATTLVLLPLELTSSFLESRQSAPLPLSIDLPKSPNVHIATIGGSTMLGFPYDPNFGIGRVVTLQLQRLFPQHQFVLDNAAQTGIHLEGAIARINRASAFPDIVILYSGHNEFFHDTEDLAMARRTHWAGIDDVARFSPLFRTLHRYLAQYAALPNPGLGAPSILGRRICPEYVLSERVQIYAGHMRRLFDWARDNDIKVVYCVPAAGDTNLAPNISAAARGDAEADILKRWQSIQSLFREGRLQDALLESQQAVDKYPDFAEFHFLLALCLRKSGDTGNARRHFVLAKDLDQLPLRCLSRWQQAGIALAKEYAIPIVHSEEILREFASDDILDEKLFLDGVHPNLRATFAIGSAVTDAVVENDFIDEAPAISNPGTFEESLSALGVTTELLIKAYRQTADVLDHYATFRGFDRAPRLLQANIWTQRAQQLENGEIEPGENGTEALRK